MAQHGGQWMDVDVDVDVDTTLANKTKKMSPDNYDNSFGNQGKLNNIVKLVCTLANNLSADHYLKIDIHPYSSWDSMFF